MIPKTVRVKPPFSIHPRQRTIQFLFFVAALFLSAFFELSSFAQTTKQTAPTAKEKFHSLCKEFSDRCQLIKEKAEQKKLPEFAKQCTQYLFVNQLSENILLNPGHQKPSLPKSSNISASDPLWLEIQKEQKEFSQKLLKLAQKIATEGSRNLSQKGEPAGYRWDSTLARKLVWLSLFWNPDNKKVRNFLGFKKKNELWVSSRYKQPKPRKSLRNHRQLKWAKRTYWIVDSGNFIVLCQFQPDPAVNLVDKLEKWRLLWRQSMMPFWVKDNVFRSRLIDLRPLSSSSESKHTVVLFANRNQFLQQLSHIDGIEQSVGYYDPKLKKSFFYLGQDGQSELISTWKHETVHQLFQESGRHSSRPAEKNNLWLMEGIAMYFESLRPYNKLPTGKRNVWLLGGTFASRLQHSRIRIFRENYFVELKEFWRRGRIEFQNSNDIVRDYSQAAGFTQFLLEYKDSAYRDATFQMLQFLYSGRSRPDMTSTVTGKDAEVLATEYKSWLHCSPSILKKEKDDGFAIPLEVISFPNSQLTGNDLTNLPTNGVKLFCLSGNKIQSIPNQWLEKLSGLEDLYLDVNPISDNTAEFIASNCTSIRQLDLASTLITDKGIAKLGKCPNLEYLWLAGTKITDRSVDSLLQIRNLKYLDIRKTQISPAGAAKLAQSIDKVLF